MTNTSLHDNSLLNGNTTGYFAQLWNQAEVCYLFKEKELTDTLTSSTADKILSILALLIHLLISVPRIMLIQLLELFVLITCILLWHTMNDFLKYGKELSLKNQYDEIFLQYSALKKAVKAINRAISVFTLCVIGVSLPFYASWTAIVFFEEDVEWKHLLHFYFYFGTFFTILSVAADFNSKSGEFYSWASDLQASGALTSNRMASLVMDMHLNQISLKGSGIFNVTYRFLGTILSVIVTYTVIIMQFQVTKRGYATKNNSDLVQELRKYLHNASIEGIY